MTGLWVGTPKSRISIVALSDDQWKTLIRLRDAGVEYWITAHDFICSNNGRALSSLTNKQLNWFYEIDATLDREVDRHEGRIAWGKEPDNED